MGVPSPFLAPGWALAGAVFLGAGDFAMTQGLARPKGPQRDGLRAVSHRAKPAPSLGSSRPHPRGGRVNRLDRSFRRGILAPPACTARQTGLAWRDLWPFVF